MTIRIYHNPACGTTRTVLATVRAAGEQPEVVEYLPAGWTRAQLERLFAAARLRPREALRAKSDFAAELGLLEPGVSDDAILVAMVRHPILVERPIVVSAKGTALCRPADKVLALLANPPAEVVRS